MIGVDAVFAGNAPCSATPLTSDMTTFQTYNNSGSTDSGIPAPDCGNYNGADFWFSVTVPANGMLDIATLAGGMTNGAMAIYEGACSNPSLLSCTEDDNCGNTIMPILNLTNLNPGTTLYLRIWAEGGGPNGTFEIRISSGPIPVPPIPTTSTVGTAQYTGANCVQLTNTAAGQIGCGDNGLAFSDIPDDHVAVNVNGNMGAAINGPFGLGNIEDGQEHEIRFTWDPITNGYAIYFDGLKYHPYGKTSRLFYL